MRFAGIQDSWQMSINADVTTPVFALWLRNLTFTLLPVRDDRILQVGPVHYLVPERVYLGTGWPAWLRTVVVQVA